MKNPRSKGKKAFGNLFVMRNNSELILETRGERRFEIYINFLTLFADRVKALVPGAPFSKVPIIKGPVKLLLFTCKVKVSIVLHLT